MLPNSQTTHLESLLLIAYNNLHLQTIHSISAFRQLALRHTFTILPQPCLPPQDHALVQEYVGRVANSFLDTHGGLLCPGAPLSQWRSDQKARRRERWSGLKEYFEVLLQIPTARPVDEVMKNLAGVGRTRADSAPARLGGKEPARLPEMKRVAPTEVSESAFDVAALATSLDAKEDCDESHRLEDGDDDWDELMFKEDYRKANIVSLPRRIDPTESCGFLMGVDEDFQNVVCAVKCTSPLELQMHREDVHHIFGRKQQQEGETTSNHPPASQKHCKRKYKPFHILTAQTLLAHIMAPAPTPAPLPRNKMQTLEATLLRLSLSLRLPSQASTTFRHLATHHITTQVAIDILPLLPNAARDIGGELADTFMNIYSERLWPGRLSAAEGASGIARNYALGSDVAAYFGTLLQLPVPMPESVDSLVDGLMIRPDAAAGEGRPRSASAPPRLPTQPSSNAALNARMGHMQLDGEEWNCEDGHEDGGGKERVTPTRKGKQGALVCGIPIGLDEEGNNLECEEEFQSRATLNEHQKEDHGYTED
ncbi:hypothetical protein LTR17_013287 [Elasticomyces elasticus]|nr:hypothetical protein LTR17_013287 [Elasticomyces elasticus]